jgi:hypothetical protein
MLGAEKKLEARKMLENGSESHLSSARFVGRFYQCDQSLISWLP